MEHFLASAASDIVDVLDAYREYGAAAFLMALLLIFSTFMFWIMFKERKHLIKQLEKFHDDEVKRTAELSTIIEASSMRTEEQNKLLGELKASIERDTIKQNELLVYLKTKDQIRGE